MSAPDKFEKLLATPEPPELGPGPRPGVETEAALDRTLNQLFDSGKLPGQKEPLIRALILLWHDHLEAAHVLAQNVENADGALVHGIMHRREPDYGNAKYWFRRAGKHPAFLEIWQRATTLLEAKAGRDQLLELVRKGEWDAFAFVDWCEKAARHSTSDEQTRVLRELQGVETRVLLDWFCT